MKSTLFLSDLHLSPERPAAAAAFRRFCEGPAREAEAVYILGDLFDWWLGDDQLRDPFAKSVAESVRAMSDAGVQVFVAHGNRDFLLGERFAAATGATLLPEQQILELGGVRMLVSHGDELCTADVEYQRYRARMRSPAMRRRLLALPYAVRRLIAAWLRRKSRGANARKPENILDVDEGAVAEAFRRFGATRIIHGHTHRPATHHVMVDGVERERIVLADWEERGRYLEVDEEAAVMREVAPPTGSATRGSRPSQNFIG